MNPITSTEIVEFLGPIAMVIGFFVQVNRVENRIIKKFYVIERKEGEIRIRFEILATRISDLEADLEKVTDYHRKNFPNIKESEEED